MKKNNLCTIYVVRHGESGGNVFGGRNLGLLRTLEKREKQRKKANKKQTTFPKIKKIHFSPFFFRLFKSKRNSSNFKTGRELAIQTTEAIRERQFGSWAGRWHLVKYKIHEELKEIAEQEKLKFVHEDVETEEHLQARLINFLKEIAVGYPGENVLVVCHGNLMRTLLWKLGWATYHELPSGSIENTGYYIVESDGVDFSLKLQLAPTLMT